MKLKICSETKCNWNCDVKSGKEGGTKTEWVHPWAKMAQDTGCTYNEITNQLDRRFQHTCSAVPCTVDMDMIWANGDVLIIRSGRIWGSAPRDVSLVTANDPQPAGRKDANKNWVPIIWNVEAITWANLYVNGKIQCKCSVNVNRMFM